MGNATPARAQIIIQCAIKPFVEGFTRFCGSPKEGTDKSKS